MAEMKALRLIIPLAALLLALLAQRSLPQTRAEVVCRGAALGFQCTVTNQKGGEAADVKWDVRVHCRNGQIVRSSAFQRVPRDASFVHLIPLADLKGLEACDAGLSVVVENLTVRAVR